MIPPFWDEKVLLLVVAYASGKQRESAETRWI
jgi:hypothetical protein